jgi:hypothetical protein
VIVSRNPAVLVGDREVSWELFSIQSMNFLKTEFELGPSAFYFIALAVNLPDTSHFIKDKIRNKLGLSKFLLVTSGQICTDPRDRFFSLYWIFNRRGIEIPKPDYAKSVHQVSKDATICALECEKSLDQLVFVHPKRRLSGYPSWVTNVCAQLAPIPIFPALDYEEYFPESFLRVRGSLYRGAAPKETETIVIHSGDKLLLSGKVITKIKSHALLSSFGEEDLKARSPETFTIAILRRWLEYLQSEVHDSKESLELVMRSILTDPHTNTSRARHIQSEIFMEWFQTMTASSESLLRPRDLNAEIADQEATNTLANELDSQDPNIDALHVLHSLLNDNAIVLELHKVLSLKLLDFTFFLTDAGYQGVAVHGIQEGDKIALLPGFIYPMIVRLVDDNCFEMIAPAFVAGIMNMEAWPKDDEDLDDLLFV